MSIKAREVSRIDSLREDQFWNSYFNKKPFVLTEGARLWSAMASCTPSELNTLHGKRWVPVVRLEGSILSEVRYASSVKLSRLADFLSFIQGGESTDLDGPACEWGIREDWSLLAGTRLVDGLVFPTLLPSLDTAWDAYLWIGGAGSVTPIHADLVAVNFHILIHGRKMVTLYGPDQGHRLYRCTPEAIDGGIYSSVNPYEPDAARHPLFLEAERQSTLLRPGDILYIPFGWWHWIRSLTLTVSCNGVAETVRPPDRFAPAHPGEP